MAEKMLFCHSCVDSDGDSIHAMKDASQDITREQFLKHVDRENLAWVEKSLGYAKTKKDGLVMADDWHVSYSRSTYRGQPCVYFTHSAIEYIFC